MLKLSGRKKMILNILEKIFLSAALAISAVIAILFTNFKVVYKVFVDGTEAGCVANKVAVEREINQYVIHGDADNVAYVTLNTSIDYELMLVKKDTLLKDEEVVAMVKDKCDVFYKVYAVNVGSEEKFVVPTMEEAQNIQESINEKQKSFRKQVDVQIEEKIVEECQFTTDIEVAVNEIIQPLQKENDELVAKTVRYASTKTVSKEVLQALKDNLQELDFGKPLTEGIITSRYGWRSLGYHYGLDIANAVGTPIHACESGVVTFAGWSGSYGYLVKVQHTGGYETYYAHCSKISAEVGDEVAKGDTIAFVGSTGRSTGPHVHLEVRYNGQTLDPEVFVYNK